MRPSRVSWADIAIPSVASFDATAHASHQGSERTNARRSRSRRSSHFSEKDWRRIEGLLSELPSPNRSTAEIRSAATAKRMGLVAVNGSSKSNQRSPGLFMSELLCWSTRSHGCRLPRDSANARKDFPEWQIEDALAPDCGPHPHHPAAILHNAADPNGGSAERMCSHRC